MSAACEGSIANVATICLLLTEKLGEALQPVPSFYGMHLAAFAKRDMDCEATSSALACRGIQIHALDRYYLQPVARTGFVLSYASADAKALTVAIDTLAQELVPTARNRRRAAAAPG